MFRRIWYHLRYMANTFFQHIFMYTLLFFFFFSSLLIIQLSDVFDIVLSQSSDMNISVYSSITYPPQSFYLEKDYIQKEDQYINCIQPIIATIHLMNHINIKYISTKYFIYPKFSTKTSQVSRKWEASILCSKPK